jgi:aarF domain-containing kinase
VDVRPIVPALANFFDDVLVASVSELNFKTIVDGLGAILYAYPFNVPAYYALIMRSLTVLEGLALSTDPNFKVLAAAYPFFASRLLADDAPALREALQELLFSGTRVRWGRLEGLLREARKSKAPPAGRVPAALPAPAAAAPAPAAAGEADALRADALPALLDLLLGPEAGTAGLSARDAAAAVQLRGLVEAEAARVAEALLLGGGLDGLAALAPLRAALPPALAALAPAAADLLPEREAAEAKELRASVLRIAELLSEQSGEGAAPVDWAAVAQLMRQPRCVAFLNAVAQRVAQRAFARTVRGVLGPQTPAQQPVVAAVAR